MAKADIVIIADYTQETPLTLEELCEICGVTTVFINDLIEYEIIRPQSMAEQEILFDLIQLKRVKTALRLQHDLEVNLAGIAVVLDLLEEMEQLRSRAALLEKLTRTE